MKKLFIDKFKLKNLFGLGSLLFGVSVLLVFQGCYPELQTVPVRKNMTWDQGENLKDSPKYFLAWNRQLEKAYTFTPTTGFPPPIISRVFAIFHVTMHDAVNSVDARYQTYASKVSDKNADPNATLIQAIYEVAKTIGPQDAPTQTRFDSLYNATMAELKDKEKKDKGIALGKQVAQAVLSKRSVDGPYLQLVGYNPTPPNGTQPGEYRYLPPLNYALAGFHKQQTWVISSADQFRPEPPFAINSPEYTADYNEVKSLGAINSVTISPDDRALGVFWAENSSRGWNRVAREVLLQNNKYTNLWETARLFALMHMAIADSYIAVFDSKIFFNYWRPISAIRLGEMDGNDQTVGDPSWTPVLVTPAVGEYPSAHAISGAAAGGVLISFFGKSAIPFSTDSGYWPGTRSFSSIDEAVRENSLSRIYIGYHFRKAIEIGEEKGYELAQFVYSNGLKPVK
ncbi:PAP2 superfamily protein [Algoriphagus boseongensis]|uniref:PAP2 superfamily protein n=1 Tax=Algoriphagus boseongensis TaxID=1442587 RepID=A0A4R6T5S5_9BACT|nr:vanadium-dependent haloperoxidase [Algoriphagus boseongensis]TDQ16669.1 PAP2 superfamily protein [Algoriphagus boseongensis]